MTPSTASPGRRAPDAARALSGERRVPRLAYRRGGRGHRRVVRRQLQSPARLRLSVSAFLRGSSLTTLLTTPIVYSLIAPLLLLDLWVTAYQWTCFPIYGIARVRRRAYLVLDRQKLPYLNAIEQLHCAYCAYATGLLAYVREVTARTEQYWCPIKHAGPVPSPHDHYQLFFDYGDAVRYRRDLSALRARLRPRQ